MKILYLCLFTLYISANVEQPQQRTLATNLNNQTVQNNLQTHPDRKAYFTPYYNLHDNDEARAPGDPIPHPKAEPSGSPYGVTPGNLTAPIPTAMNGISMANPMSFGMGLTQPPAFSLHHPSTNPFQSFGQGFGGATAAAGNTMGSLNPMNPLGGNAMNNEAVADQKIVAASFPELSVVTHCDKVKRQAINVANQIIRQQNKKLFKDIMNYLLKAKFLVGMTEIKLNKTLRKKIFSLMKDHANITEDNISFMNSSFDEMIDDGDLDDLKK